MPCDGLDIWGLHAAAAEIPRAREDLPRAQRVHLLGPASPFPRATCRASGCQRSRLARAAGRLEAHLRAGFRNLSTLIPGDKFRGSDRLGGSDAQVACCARRRGRPEREFGYCVCLEVLAHEASSRPGKTDSSAVACACGGPSRRPSLPVLRAAWSAAHAAHGHGCRIGGGAPPRLFAMDRQDVPIERRRRSK
ncbi:hypothetical protein DENSPDRAFT_233221 [Dentipellis sp. KUC8613]|nr:hypothetical protein DENSPDRAFT_233221 [Dentipellis sp. KUC8613]